VKPIKIKRSVGSEPDFPLPAYGTSGSVGMDLRACLSVLDQRKGIELEPNDRLLVSSGFMMDIPEGFEGQIRARSGLALRYGIGILNSPGTIDSDYRGDIKILLINFGSEPFLVKHRERIAQLVISPIIRAVLEIETNLSKTNRNGLGFGSTGNL
jgi:dUTP pyrophosphatase